MAEVKRKRTPEELAIPQMPFEDAIKRILSAPPQHKPAKKKAEKK